MSYRLTARQIALAVARRDLSARQVAHDACARVADINPRLNALIDVDNDDVLAQADTVDRRIAAGEHLPLAGVPISIKDNIWVAGRRIGFGSRLYADFIAPRDAWSVARLRQAGALILGISNCSEFACKGVTDNLVHGATRNPWDLARTPGGSSGGAVAAVAA
ncbi:MAG: amidase family protein, partial [Rhodocyclaceae bacterium]